jgi:hypothetical protein
MLPEICVYPLYHHGRRESRSSSVLRADTGQRSAVARGERQRGPGRGGAIEEG